jgi:hypothetical protein
MRFCVTAYKWPNGSVRLKSGPSPEKNKKIFYPACLQKMKAQPAVFCWRYSTAKNTACSTIKKSSFETPVKSMLSCD